MKTKIRFYSNEATDFDSRKIPKAGSNCISWSVISIISVLKKDGNYYLQLFLTECKHIEKDKKVMMMA